MRLLHALHDFLPRHRAGSELYVAHLAQAQQRRGHEVHVLCAEYDPSRAHGSLTRRAFASLPVHEVVNNWSFQSLDESWRSPRIDEVLARVLDEVRPEVVHVHNLLNLSFSLPALARARGAAVVATLHDYALVCASGGQRLFQEERHVCHRIEPARCARCFSRSPYASFIASARLPLGRGRGAALALARRAAAHLPRVVAFAQAAARAVAAPPLPDSAVARRLEGARGVFGDVDLFVAPSASLAGEYVSLGLPAEKLELSDNGHRPLPSAPRPPRRERLRVGFVGTLAFHKGAHVLLEACRALPADRYEAALFGSLRVAPSYVSELQAAAAGLPVQLRGEFDEARAGEVYAQLDVLVVSSLWLENSPLVIHEAFQAGVPVVGSNLGGIPGLVEHEANGLIYDAWSSTALAAALRRLLDEPGLLERLSAGAARTTVKSIEADAAQWDARYARVTEARR